MTIWDELRSRAGAHRGRRIIDLFGENASRAADFSVAAGDLLLDYAKTNLDEPDRAYLLQLAARAELCARRDAMFSGEKINETEGRAVLHTALRADEDAAIFVDGEDVMPELRRIRARMVTFAEVIRSGDFQGQGGTITDVVNIGIGGSDLGPAMAVGALGPYVDGPRCHFVSNIDGAHIHDTLRGLDPGRVLIIVASKAFTTIETMTNAQTARAWMAQSVKEPAQQFVALSSATERCATFGIPKERVFGFEDWVGGRYSLWGPIGLSLMLAIGPKNFDAMLAGGRQMDRHFCQAPLEQNMPVLLALIGLWHHQGFGCRSRAVLPYEQRLGRLPAYLQQLEMESNGKSVAMDGQKLGGVAGPIVWGEPGTNGQHAFYQLIHQGGEIVPCEFIVGARGHEEALAHQHELLLANCLAQSEALMLGRDFAQAQAIMRAKGLQGTELDRQARHRVFAGNRPSTTLVYPLLTPSVLGQIIVLYEHRVFVEGVILGINSFDQWGVELGKELATGLQPMVAGSESFADKDGSTQQLLHLIHKLRRD